MINTKIVIDKTLFDKLVLSEVNDDSSNDLIDFLECLRSISDEIQIDQPIEDAAKEYLNKNCLIGTRYKKVIYEVSSFDLLEFSKQQQIIEQLRVKEKEVVESEHLNWWYNLSGIITVEFINKYKMAIPLKESEIYEAYLKELAF